MDMLELQQRANILVEKVNQYEASLEGTTWDENEILNQHLYADLFCLRPVIKLLFGKNLSEKLSRTLDNDVNIKLYASNAPAHITQFDFFVPSNVQTDTGYKATGTSEVEDNKIEMAAGYAYSYVFFPTINSPGEGTSTITNRKFKVKVQLWDEFDTSSSIINISFIRTSQRHKVLKLTLNKDTSAILLMGNPIINLITPVQPNDTFDIEYDIDYENNRITTCRLTIVHNSTDTYNYTYTFTPYHNGTYYTMCQVDFLEQSDDNKYQFPRYVFKDSISCTYTLVEVDTNRTSQTHALAANYDMYHDYNMVQLDTYENELETRNTRIAHGINYSYSANIYDALITESQIANVFKWNTYSSDTVIKNNQISHNRQVPGIVLYYLGNNYDGTYTATVPYSTDAENINSVNYNYPSIYGAYYMMDNIAQSQVGPDMGHEALKMFVPGLNFFNGRLYSPQQIYQPAKLFGQENLGKGFNYQGSALYHELVFKDKRSDIDIDFSSMDSDIDNDKQGLATRLVLAQQADYYYNRPWFNELNPLQGQEMCTKLCDNINDNAQVAGSKFYTLTTGPLYFDDDGVNKFNMSLDTSTGILEDNTLNSPGTQCGFLVYWNAENQQLEWYIRFKYDEAGTGNQTIWYSGVQTSGRGAVLYIFGGDTMMFDYASGTQMAGYGIIEPDTWIDIHIIQTAENENKECAITTEWKLATETTWRSWTNNVQPGVNLNPTPFNRIGASESSAFITYDLTNSFLKVGTDGEQKSVVDYVSEFSYNMLRQVGTLNDNSGIVSGFSADDYYTYSMPTTALTKRNINFKVTLGSDDATGVQPLISSNTFCLYVSTTNKRLGLTDAKGVNSYNQQDNLDFKSGDELEVSIEISNQVFNAKIKHGTHSYNISYTETDLYSNLNLLVFGLRIETENCIFNGSLDKNSVQIEQIADTVDMTDTEFYNNYSVDYNTYKEAIDGI